MEPFSGMSSSSAIIDVPADGLCFYHCLGGYLRADTEYFLPANAIAIRKEICRAVRDMGFEEEATRLTTEGSAGYPDELAFAAAATLLGGRFEVLSIGGRLLAYGDGHFRFIVCCTHSRE